MERNDYRGTTLPGSAALKNRTQAKPPSVPAAAKDGIDDYIDRNMDLDGLAGDIKALVASRLQTTIPDDKRLILDLVSQVGELTGEIKELRQQLESKPYEVFSCPSGQIRDMTAELVEIKALLQKEPRPRELSGTEPEQVSPPVMPRQPEIRQPESRQPELTRVEASIPPAAEIPAPPPPQMAPPPVQQTGASPPVQSPVTAQSQPVQTPPPPETGAPPPRAPEPMPEREKHPEDEGGKKKGKSKKKAKKKRTAISIIGNIFFYVAVIGVVLGAFLVKSGSGGQPTVIAGYSAFTVLSSSMEDTYPKGSLIVTHAVDANELKVGDDITYMVSATSSITHRIIGITESYLDTGARAFETQGTMNEKPDKEPVAAANVVGKVVFCSVLLGTAATFVSSNWPILLFFVVVLAALVTFLKWNFRREDEKEEKAAAKGKEA